VRGSLAGLSRASGQGGLRKLPPRHLVRVFAVLEVTAGGHKGAAKAVDRFREDARKGRHPRAGNCRDASLIGEFDGLDPSLQVGRCVEDLASADDGPVWRAQHRGFSGGTLPHNGSTLISATLWARPIGQRPFLGRRVAVARSFLALAESCSVGVLKRTPGREWFKNSIPNASRATWTLRTVTALLVMGSAPRASMFRIVFTFTPAESASCCWSTPASARAAFN
jgi:hypothetical protein